VSTEKEKVRELAYQIEEQYQKRQPAKDRTAPMTGAKMALMASAGGLPNLDYALSVKEEDLSAIERKLRLFGCDFIGSSYLLMKEHGCNKDARDYVQIMMAMLRGNPNLAIVKDEWVAEFSGLSVKSVVRKRKALKAWQFTSNVSLIEIHEQPRTKGTTNYRPTMYRDVFSQHVVRFSIELTKLLNNRTPHEAKSDLPDGKEKPQLWGDMAKEKEPVIFPHRLSSETVRQTARRIGEDFSTDVIPPRPKYDTSRKTFEPRDSGLTTAEEKLCLNLAWCRDAARKQGRSAYSWWNDFKQKAAVILTTPTPGYPDPEDND
jgi:hypothetical protein